MSMTRGRLAMLVVLGVVVAVGIAAFLLWRSASSATLANEDGALADLRARGAGVEAQPRTGVPRPGVYTYTQTGREGAAGVVDVSRDLPSTALYVVAPTREGYHEDLRFSEEHVEEARFAVDERETRALWRRTKVSFAGIGEDTQADQTPPPVDHPHRLRVGASWGGSYSSGDVPITFRSRVIGARSVSLDGRQVQAMVIRTDARTGGAQPGIRRDEIWWAPALSLPVRWSIVQDYEGSAPFEMEAQLELQSARPRT
jgi:hypothetical protein